MHPCCLIAALFLLLVSRATAVDGGRVYFGTYTKAGGSEGIYTANFDGDSGKLGEPVLAAKVASPSFLAIESSGKTLYAVSEVGGADGGRVTAFRVLDSGQLEQINDQVSGGDGPCHLSLSPDQKTLAVANYGGGSVASYRIDEDGALSAPVSVIRHSGRSVDPKRQKEPHAHSVNFSPDGRFAYAADLGTDRIYVYSVDGTTSALEPVGETVITPGSGPRHFTFRPDGKFAYVINEMILQVTAFRADAASGALTEIQSLGTLPDGVAPFGSTAEVVAHPLGKFLYGSNRGHDTIVVYSIDESSGRLTRIENEPIRGKTPRHFVVSPDGGWLLAAGQQSDTVTVFAIDEKTGALDFADSQIRVSSPVCIRFLPNP